MVITNVKITSVNSTSFPSSPLNLAYVNQPKLTVNNYNKTKLRKLLKTMQFSH